MECKATDKTQSPKKDCGKGHSGFKYLGMMLICCLVPLGAVFVLKQLGYSGIASNLMLLLCPIMHIFMMRNMFKEHAEPQSDIKNEKSSGGSHG